MKKLISMFLCVFTLHANAGQTGFGNSDCGKWVSANTPARKAWLLGYLSGMSTMWVGTPKDPLDKIDSAEQIYLWMDNYCKSHPLEKLDAGAILLFAELAKK